MPDLVFELSVFDLLDFQRLMLLALGLLVFVHLICTANFMPSGAAPSIWMPVAVGVACAVLVVHGAVFDDVERALWAAAAAAADLVLMQIGLWISGYHVGAHLKKRIDAQTQNQAAQAQ